MLTQMKGWAVVVAAGTPESNEQKTIIMAQEAWPTQPEVEAAVAACDLTLLELISVQHSVPLVLKTEEGTP